MTDQGRIAALTDELRRYEAEARTHEVDMAALRYRMEAAEAAVARLEGKVASLQTQLTVVMWGVGLAVGGMVATIALVSRLG